MFSFYGVRTGGKRFTNESVVHKGTKQVIVLCREVYFIKFYLLHMSTERQNLIWIATYFKLD